MYGVRKVVWGDGCGGGQGGDYGRHSVRASDVRLTGDGVASRSAGPVAATHHTAAPPQAPLNPPAPLSLNIFVGEISSQGDVGTAWGDT